MWKFERSVNETYIKEKEKFHPLHCSISIHYVIVNEQSIMLYMKSETSNYL